MKQILSFLWALALSMAMVIQAQVKPTAEQCFKSMPDLLLPSSETMRLDLIDYYKSGLRSHVKGPFDNAMEIKSMTDSYLKVTTSRVGDMQVKILPVDSVRTDSSAFVLAVIRTVQGPVASSDMSFYTLSWHPIKGAFTVPDVQSEAFWNLQMLDSLSQESIPDAIDGLESVEINPRTILLSASLFTYSFNPNDNTLTIKSSAEKQLDRAIFRAVSPAFRPTLRYTWQYGRFVAQNQAT